MASRLAMESLPRKEREGGGRLVRPCVSQPSL